MTRLYACRAEFVKEIGSRSDLGVDDWRLLFHGSGWGRTKVLGLGPQTVKFFVRPECYPSIPVKTLGEDPGEFVNGYHYQLGEIPILFAYGEGMRTAIRESSPLRRDGFVLVLEWRKGVEDSPLLSSAFHVQAQLVREQLNVADLWGLWPAERVYGDKVDFSDPLFFHDEENADRIASSYGALLAGLWCATESERRGKSAWPDEWSFPTMRWNAVTGSAGSVGGIREKLSVAVDCGARVLAVVRSQKHEAQQKLRELKQEFGGGRFGNIQVCGVSDQTAFGMGRVGPVVLARRVCDAVSSFRRRVLLTTFSYGAVVLSVCLICWLYSWDQKRDILEYYADYVNEWGIPEGLNQMSKLESRRAERHFRMVFRKSKGGAVGVWVKKRRLYLHSLDYCNSDGGLCAYQSKLYDSTRVARRVFESNKDGSLSGICFQDEYGQDLARASVSSGDAFDIISANRIGRREAEQKGILVGRYGVGDGDVVRPYQNFGLFAGLIPGECRYSDERCRVVVTDRTASGLPKRMFYYPNNRTRTPVCGVLGEYGVECVYDDKGRLVKGLFLSKDGKPLQATNHIVGVSVFFDRMTNEVAYVDSANVPQTNRWGWVRHREVRDRDGWRQKEEYVGVDGKLMFGPNGYARATFAHDVRGHWQEVRFEDPEGKLTCSDKGVAIMRLEKPDRRRKRSFVRCFDADGKPCYSRLGVSAVECVRENGMEAEFYYNDRGLPEGPGGVCEKTMRFDQDGRVNKVLFYGPGHVPVVAPAFSAHGVELKYQDDGLLSECRFLDFDGTSTKLAGGVFGRMRFEYEFLAGQVSKVKTICCGMDEVNPVVFNGMEMVQEMEIDMYGNIVGVSNIELGDAAYQKLTYDECGRVVMIENFESDRRTRAVGRQLGSVIEMEYDEIGQLRAISYYGVDYSENCQQFVLGPKGFARLEQSDYTIFGKPRRQDFYGIDKRPLYTHFKEYDGAGREICSWKQKPDGEPYLDADSQAEMVKYEYDSKGNCTTESIYRIDGDRSLCRDGQYHRSVKCYDECGQCVKTYFEDCAGNRVPEANTGILCYEKKYDKGVLSRIDKTMANGILSQWIRDGIVYTRSPEVLVPVVTFVGMASPDGVRLVCAVDGVQCFGNIWLTIELLTKNPQLAKNVVLVEAQGAFGGVSFQKVSFSVGLFKGAEVLSAGRPWLSVECTHMLYDMLQKWCDEHSVKLRKCFTGTPQFRW